MNPLAAAAFERLQDATLFYAVGIQDTEVAKVLVSWDDAINHCNSPEWETWWLEATNQIGDKVQAVSVARYQFWNDITHEIKETVIPLVATKCEPVAKAHNLPASFFYTVRWDVLHFFVELEYSDIATPGFYHTLWEWYMKGHFPCGWEGEYPSGRPIIY